MLQFGYSVVGIVLIESTEYGELVSKIRQELYTTYGDHKSKEINMQIDIIVEIVRNLKESIDKGRMTESYFSIAGTAMLVEATKLGLENIAIENTIRFIDYKIYQQKILRIHFGGGFSGGGAGGLIIKNNTDEKVLKNNGNHFYICSDTICYI